MEATYSNIQQMNRYKMGCWRYHATEKPRLVWSESEELDKTPTRDGWMNTYATQTYPRTLFKGQKNARRFPLGYSTVIAKDATDETQLRNDGYVLSVEGLQRRPVGADDIDEAAEEAAVQAEQARLGGGSAASAIGAAFLKENSDLKSEVASLRDAVQQLLAAHQSGAAKGRKAQVEA